ncbi:MAG: lytic murein transglycosylase B [Pseudazoarcus pumilus]|nr:lytic murein transglycosylase B [Pseudazoarcus pumilus]
MTLQLRRAVVTALICLLPPCASASYIDHNEARDFMRDMQQRHGFSAGELEAVLGQASRIERVIELIRPPTEPGQRSWQRYRSRFLTDRRIDEGVSFWLAHRDTVEAASARYGVPPEFIVSILGIETNYGSYTGNFETVSALATLAFDYPPRAPLFRRELENLLLLAREQNRDPFSYSGSYAGALGYPQFLPSSVRSYAVDFDGDSRIEFDANPVDAIGSIANYFAVHGWRSGEPVAQRIYLPPDLDVAPLIAAGIEPSLHTDALRQRGIGPISGEFRPDLATVFDLPTPDADTEYWVGYRNFYVITRYNRSSFYAMAVFELAEAVRQRLHSLSAARP